MQVSTHGVCKAEAGFLVLLSKSEGDAVHCHQPVDALFQADSQHILHTGQLGKAACTAPSHLACPRFCAGTRRLSEAATMPIPVFCLHTQEDCQSGTLWQIWQP